MRAATGGRSSIARDSQGVHRPEDQRAIDHVSVRIPHRPAPGPHVTRHCQQLPGVSDFFSRRLERFMDRGDVARVNDELPCEPELPCGLRLAPDGLEAVKVKARAVEHPDPRRVRREYDVHRGVRHYALRHSPDDAEPECEILRTEGEAHNRPIAPCDVARRKEPDRRLNDGQNRAAPGPGTNSLQNPRHVVGGAGFRDDDAVDSELGDRVDVFGEPRRSGRVDANQERSISWSLYRYR